MERTILRKEFAPGKMGGFNFGTEDKILRWLHRGDTLYDVIIPNNAQVICVDKEKGIHILVGEFARDNSKSKKVMEKLGMTYWKDSKYSKFDGSATFDSYLYKREYK